MGRAKERERWLNEEAKKNSEGSWACTQCTSQPKIGIDYMRVEYGKKDKEKLDDHGPWPYPIRSQQISQWIGLRDNLQETIDFPIKYGAFL
jgi:hypothetical protein